MRFDIIPDHKAGFADAIVCHDRRQWENGMGRKAGIVTESCGGRPAVGRAGARSAPWHTFVSPGHPVGFRRPFH